MPPHTMLPTRAAAAWLARRVGDSTTTSTAATIGAAFSLRSFAKAAGGPAAATPVEDRKAANQTALLVKVRRWERAHA